MSKEKVFGFTITPNNSFGDIDKSRSFALKKLGRNVSHKVISSVLDYEHRHKNSAISGTIDIFIEELPGRHLPNKILGSSNVILNREHPNSSVDYSQYEQDCAGLSFYYPHRQRLIRIWLKMKIVDNHNLSDSKQAAKEIEEGAISAVIKGLPDGNYYLKDHSRRARHHTAKGVLLNYGTKSFDGPDAYLDFMKKYGFDIDLDHALLMSIWAKISNDPSKEVTFDAGLPS